MIVKIQATSLALSPEEIRQKIGPSVLAEIKKTDPSPYFQVFSILQEGKSYPKIINEGHKVIAWSRKAISTIKDVVTKSVEFFVGHNSDNTTNGRRSVGEVIADFSQEVNGRLNHLVIGYFPDKEEAKKYDVCSVEADVDMSEAGSINIAQRISKLTGIALGNSRQDKPAFAGAVKVGQLQAFAQPADKEDTEKINSMQETQKMNITFEQLVKGIKDLRVHPNDVFDMAAMAKDHVYGKIIEEHKTLKASNESLTGEVEQLNKKIKLSSEVGTAKNRLDTFLPGTMTEKQKSFVNLRFKPENFDDLSDKVLKDFAENTLKEYAELAKAGLLSEVGKDEGAGGSDTDNNTDKDNDIGVEKDVVDTVVDGIIKG